MKLNCFSKSKSNKRNTSACKSVYKLKLNLFSKQKYPFWGNDYQSIIALSGLLWPSAQTITPQWMYRHNIVIVCDEHNVNYSFRIRIFPD